MVERTFGFRPGQIVVAEAGREAGHCFVVVGLDAAFLYLADGDKRPLERPKKKNPRHVRVLSGVDAHLPAPPFTNRAIREALRAVEGGGRETWPSKT